jgi:very-short-patch-repair endonuclease
MNFALTNKTKLTEMYVDKNMNASEIAVEFSTYPNKILRALKYLGITLKERSEIQSTVLKSGKVEHPTKGKKMSDETKNKISQNIHHTWENKPEEEREAFRLKKKQQWDSRPADEVSKFNTNSVKGIIKASKEGSKAEKAIMERLIKLGYNVLHHQKPLQNERLEVDLLLKDNALVIEIDGMSHYEPVWGDEVFERTRKADNEKNGILILNGYTVIRIKNVVNTATKYMYDNIVEKVVEIMKLVRTNSLTDKLIVLDIETGDRL